MVVNRVSLYVANSYVTAIVGVPLPLRYSFWQTIVLYY